jgi:hypothetical protein
VLVSLGTLLLAEGLVRLAIGDRIAVFPRFHTRAEYGPFILRRLRPDTTFRHRSVDGTWFHRVNGQGFRADREHTHAKPAGRLRVICLGDSHTQGFECRQGATYSARLEAGLRARGYDAEVINAGVSGFGTAEQLAFLENEGVRYAPDVVVAGFFANDYEDNLKSDLFRLQEGALVTNKVEHIPGVDVLDRLNAFPPTRWASQYSYLYSILLNTVWDRAKRSLLDEATRRAVTEFAVAQGAAAPEEQRIQGELAAALLQRMAQFCAAQGIRLVLLDIPQLDPGGEAFASSIFPAQRERFRKLGDAALLSTEVLAPYAGLYEVFVAHGQRHISETTHLLLATALTREVTRLVGPPPAAPTPTP